MKKLLLIAALAMTVSSSVFAITEEDITPAGYSFSKLTTFAASPFTFTGANIGVPVWTTCKGADNYHDGMLVIGGGQFANTAQPYYKDACAGISIVDLGGEVGKVFAMSGVNSKVNDKLKELYNVDMQIPSCTGSLNWFNLNWFTDPNNTPKSATAAGANGVPTDCNIRVRLVMNVFANTLGETNAIVNKSYAVSDQGGINPVNDNTAAKTEIFSGEFCKYYADDPTTPEEDANGNLIWDPTRWLVYEFDTWCPANSEDGTTFSPLRLKMEFNQGNFASATVFIKEISFSKITDNDAPIVNTRSHTWKTYQLTPATGIQRVTSDNGTVQFTKEGNNVKFAAPTTVYTADGRKVAEAKEGANVGLNSGIYVAKSGKSNVKFVVK
jgi:hypothetical protein